jgi:methyl-accepting chemotaxis protein
MTMGKNYKRRNIFIKKDFQGKLILGYFLFVTGGCLFFIVLLAFFSADTLTVSYTNNDLQLGQTPIMLMKSVLAAHWVFIVVGTMFLVVAAMLITHRIAGPLFRIEKALDNMVSGNLNDVIFLREKDEGKDLAQKLNQFNLELSMSIRDVRNHSEAIANLIKQTQVKSSQLPAELKEEFDSLCWGIEEKNKKIQTMCSAYSLRDE